MLFKVLLVITLAATAHVTTAKGKGPKGPKGPKSPRSDGFPCCLCGRDISVELQIKNNLEEPHFDEDIYIRMGQRELLFFLETAADRDNKFRFSANYGAFGYFISTINGRTAEGSKFWKITDGFGSLLNKGVSSYVPSDGETIIFTLADTSA